MRQVCQLHVAVSRHPHVLHSSKLGGLLPLPGRVPEKLHLRFPGCLPELTVGCRPETPSKARATFRHLNSIVHQTSSLVSRLFAEQCSPSHDSFRKPFYNKHLATTPTEGDATARKTVGEEEGLPSGIAAGSDGALDMCIVDRWQTLCRLEICITNMQTIPARVAVGAPCKGRHETVSELICSCCTAKTSKSSQIHNLATVIQRTDLRRIPA